MSFNRPFGGGLIVPRNSNSIVVLGDSRGEQTFADGSNRNRSEYAILSQALAQSGQRGFIAANDGKSGDRVDQVWARLMHAILSGAGVVHIHCGDANDIGQAFAGFTALNNGGPYAGVAVTLANVAMVSANTILAMCDAAIAAGMKVILCNGYGAGNFVASQITALMEFNQRLREGVDARSNIALLDLFSLFVDPAASTPNALAYRAGYLRNVAGDVNLHPATLGAVVAGSAEAALLVQMMPPRQVLVASAAEVPAASLRNLLNNPVFTTTSGGTLNGGATGTVPGSWTGRLVTNASGSASIAVSTAPAASGIGNDCVLTLSGGAGDRFRLGQDIALANWAAGDIVQLSGRVSLDAGSSGVACITAQIDCNNDSSTISTMDGFSDLTHGFLPTTKLDLVRCTEKLMVPAFTTKGFMTSKFDVLLGANGSAVVRIGQAQTRKLFA